MKQARFLKYSSVVVTAGVLVAAHGLFVYRISSHMAREVGLGLILLLLALHVGLLGPIYALFKRRSQDE